MDEPHVTTGLVKGPRDPGSIAYMLLAGRFDGQLQTRIIICTGLTFTACMKKPCCSVVADPGAW